MAPPRPLRTVDKAVLVLTVAAAVAVTVVQFGVLAPRARAATVRTEVPYHGTGLDHELVYFEDEGEATEARLQAPASTQQRMVAAAERLAAARAAGEAAAETVDDDDMLTADPALLL